MVVFFSSEEAIKKFVRFGIDYYREHSKIRVTSLQFTIFSIVISHLCSNLYIILAIASHTCCIFYNFYMMMSASITWSINSGCKECSKQFKLMKNTLSTCILVYCMYRYVYVHVSLQIHMYRYACTSTCTNKCTLIHWKCTCICTSVSFCINWEIETKIKEDRYRKNINNTHLHYRIIDTIKRMESWKKREDCTCR